MSVVGQTATWAGICATSAHLPNLDILKLDCDPDERDTLK
jgi:hypothetical protein